MRTLSLFPVGLAFILSACGAPLPEEELDTEGSELSIRAIANAGPDQSVLFGQIVTLDGTKSIGSLIKWEWVQKSGPAVVLDDRFSKKPTFKAPVPTKSTSLTFELTVTNHMRLTGTDSVTVTVLP